MVGNSKRGGFQSRGDGDDLKKRYTKKRLLEDDDVPQAGKRSKSGDDEQDDAVPMVPRLETDEDDNPFIAINSSGKRRVTVSDFKGTTLISIREYWKNDGGELKPGKKGISLSVGQYNALLAAAPLLETVLNKRDIQVARPDYGADVKAADLAGEGQQPTTNIANNDDED